MRFRRQSIAVMMMVGLMFAQIVAMAHACPLLLPQGDASMQVALPDRAPMPADCVGMTGQPDSTSTANACESHCNTGQQIDVQSAALSAPIGLQPVLTIRVVEHGIPDPGAAIWLSSLRAAPSLSLLFGHFLI
jgi:hypothetical protein